MKEVVKKIKVISKMDEGDVIRHHLDEKTGKWYFSIVDIMGIVTNSTDARNYWKVLKNRLSKRQNELVTRCNQLKMRAKDGKYYLTDVGDVETILDILKTSSPLSVEKFNSYFETFLSNAKSMENVGNHSGETKLLVDAYQTQTDIIIEAMIAGVPPDNVSLEVTPNKIIIKGRRETIQNTSTEDSPKNYLKQELKWFNFYRTISLPVSVDTEKIETTHESGWLKIKLPKLK